jgi:hypothetical protein
MPTFSKRSGGGVEAEPQNKNRPSNPGGVLWILLHRPPPLFERNEDVRRNRG